MMSRYSELGSAYGKWRSVNIEYMRECQFYIRKFAMQFREYLEAPEDYHEFSNGLGHEPTKHKTVSLMEARREPNGTYEFTRIPDSQIAPDLLRADDGSFVTALRLVVEEMPNRHPKAAYGFPVYFSLSDKICTMRIGEERSEPVTFNVDDPNEIRLAFDRMVGWLQDIYSRDPRDRRDRQSIGFLAEIKS